jgi:endonuclease-3 related protein
MLDAEFNGALDTMAGTPTQNLRKRLLALPGVGPETADAILLYALGHPVPVADEYLRRIVELHLPLAPSPKSGSKGYESLVRLTLDAFATEPAQKQAPVFNEFHALIAAVGKSHCGRTPRCEGCPLAADLRLARP